MKLSGSHSFDAPRERVWKFLNDPERLARCLPGCEKLETIGENEYAGEVNVGLAAVRGRYQGKVRLDDIRAPEHYRMNIDGKGQQGFIRGSGTLDLEERDGRTELRYEGEAQVGGQLASVGQRMIDGAARTMMAQFFTAMEAEISAPEGTRARQGILLNFFRLLWKRLRSLFR